MDPAAPVPIERLLEHRDWVRTLAGALVGDASRADDVAQDAWLAALRNPPRHATGLKTWLRRLVRHRAANARRSETRRTAYESASLGPRPAGDPAEAVARIEELERVVRAVLSLAEPYRTAVVLRFYEDLDAHEIAARTAAPVETVRTRLKRALAQLRERLDADHGGDGRAWSAALLPLATHHLVGANAGVTLGGVAVTTKTKTSLALAALALLALTASVVVSGGRNETPAATGGIVAVGTTGPRQTQTRQYETAAAKPGSAAPGTALPRGTATIVGSVRFADGNRLAVGQTVVLETAGSASASCVTDDAGRFRFERLAEDRAWRVRVSVRGFAPIVLPDIRLGRDEVRDLGVLRLTAPVRLDVTVKDWGDRGIAGATVEVHPGATRGTSFDMWTLAVPYRHVPEPVVSATTNAAGLATVPEITPGEWTIVASAAGFATGWTEHVAVAPGVGRHAMTLRLDRGHRIEGRVLGGDGRPVPGALVWAVGKSRYAGAAVFPRAASGADGRFVLDGVPPGEAALCAGREGTTPAELLTVRVPTTAAVDLVLDGSTVEGRVTAAADGMPVAGARVLLYVMSDREGWVAEALTGEDGRYRLDTVRAGHVQYLRVERAGYSTLCETWDRPGDPLVMENGHGTRDFTLRRGVPIAGRVTSPDGPVAGVPVVAGWGGGGAGLVQTTAFTDGDGRFAIPDAPAQTVVLQVLADGLVQPDLPELWLSELFAGRKPGGSFDVPETGLCDVEINMTPGRVVTGRVEGPDGSPVAGASVSGAWAKTTSGDDGSFRLVLAKANGAAQVSASKESYGWAFRELQLPAAGPVEGLVIRLSQGAKVTGRVTGPGGAAPDGASVVVLFEFAPDRYGQGEVPCGRATVADGGRFETNLPQGDGRFRVQVSAPGFAPATSAVVTVETGRASYEADLVLGPAIVLTGRVVSSANERTPAANAKLSLLPADWKPKPLERRPFALAAVTDADGRFRIEGLAPGGAKVDVVCDGFVHAVLPIHLPASGELVLELEPALEIAGTVRLADGTPFARASVCLRREKDERVENWWSLTTGADGRFRATGLPAGSYWVSAFPAYASTVSTRRFETTGVAAGTTDLEIVLESAAEIAGRALGADGRPLAGCSVQAMSETGDRFAPSDQTKEDGSFVIRGLGSGTYALVARPPQARGMGRPSCLAYGATLLATRVTGIVPGTKDAEVRLPAGAQIRGTLLDGSGAPLVGSWVRADLLPGQEVDPYLNTMYPALGAQTDATGAFAITGLWPGRYRIVQVLDPLSALPQVRPLRGGDDVTAGASGVRVVAGGVASITGIVVDEEDHPIAEAGVGARPVGGGPAVYIETGASGTFTLDGVSDLAKWTVTAAKTGLVSDGVLDVAAGATGLRLRLVRGLEATGRVLQRDGTPFAKGYVRLALEGSDYKVSAPTDADGRFTAKALKEGLYRVEEILMVVRAGERSTPRPCGTIRAGGKDVELRMTE